MGKIAPGYFLPSAAIVVPKNRISTFEARPAHVPQVGDLVYAKVTQLGQHQTLENKQGRCHILAEGARFIGVFGNRYAPDYYEGFVPKEFISDVDMLARSGIVGIVYEKNSNVVEPTKVQLLGYVTDKKNKVINTLDYCQITPRATVKQQHRAKMVLVVGTAMNSGKTEAASTCCWALSNLAHDVRASKITGTACLKDILRMQDLGASNVRDFSYFGLPSTYKISEQFLLKIFNDLDLKYANNPKNYWVVEIADGIFQRETALLLQSKDVQSRIHRLIFTAQDAAGAVGGVRTLKERFGLQPDAISGVCAGSPLSIREMESELKIPVFNSRDYNLQRLGKILR